MRPRDIALVTALLLAAAGPSTARADDARTRQIVAALDPLRRALTVCTVDRIAQSRDSGQTAEARADRALADCGDKATDLRAKATDLLGPEAAARLMDRLDAETRAALVESARLLGSDAVRSGGAAGWPRVLTDRDGPSPAPGERQP
ncbi:hypothetical protein [Pleomorphomonas carboxyditropha]|uniref:hypothetical protein n=1 Tax=Pleomorphomonas carboxyditropha TaxID=2023338 RepID=UPI001054D7DB|nr:hypothetical protein [Pleomorphomonas carboxyditropha]